MPAVNDEDFDTVFDGRGPRLEPIDETENLPEVTFLGDRVIKSENVPPEWFTPDDQSLMPGAFGEGHDTDAIYPPNGDPRLPPEPK